MRNDYYEHIYDNFKFDHPYLEVDVVEWRPRGEQGIRVTLRDMSQYDYNMSSRGVRRVKVFDMSIMEDITDEKCRSCVAYNLIELMDIRGFSQNTLAEATGLGRGSINNYINGKATPSITALIKIARALNCEVGDLIH